MKKIELTVGKRDMDCLEELLFSNGVKTYVSVEFSDVQAGEGREEGEEARGTRLEFYLSNVESDKAVPAILRWCGEKGSDAMLEIFSMEECIRVRTIKEGSSLEREESKCLKLKNRVF